MRVRCHAVLLPAILLLGCGRAASPIPTQTAANVTGAAGSGTPGAAGAAVPKPLLDQVAADAAGKNHLANAAQVRVISAQRVDWPDSSLGCPQPGFMYSQIVTPGYRITVEANGRHEYHTDLASRFVVC